MVDIILFGYRESVKRMHAKYWGRKKPTFKQNPLSASHYGYVLTSIGRW